MNISTRTKSSVTILDLSGKLIIGDASLSRTVSKLAAGGTVSILINMDGLTMMDSSGLGELVRSKQLAGSKGAKIKLLNVKGSVGKVFDLANLGSSFEVFSSESTAVASF